MMTKPIKIIDLFAGPGGLGEGFSSYQTDEGDHPFRISLSVEMEYSAWRTLRLRAFLRQFIHHQQPIPKEYYLYLEGTITEDQLYEAYPEQKNSADNEAVQKELGKDEDNKFVYKAIKDKLGDTKDWLLIGGPPCQAYSLVGRARNRGNKDYVAEKDHRHLLYREYLKIIDQFSPAVFVMENVKGILSSRLNGELIFHKILEDLKNPGKALGSRSKMTYTLYSISTDGKTLDGIEPSYDPHDYIIKAEEYGIPQARHRVILVGVRNDIHAKPATLKKLHPVTVGDAISDLPKLRSGLSKHGKHDTHEDWVDVISDEFYGLRGKNAFSKDSIRKEIDAVIAAIAKSSLTRGKVYTQPAPNLYENMPDGLRSWYSKNWNKGICNHETRGHMDADLARYLFCSISAKLSGSKTEGNRNSPKLQDFPNKLLPNHKNATSGKFVDRFKVQEEGLPATTITSHISKDGHYFIHYDPLQCRSLTVREAARIQTFPDSYFFEGTRTQQYVQVGNAVPPLLANRIAHIVLILIRSK